MQFFIFLHGNLNTLFDMDEEEKIVFKENPEILGKRIV